MVTAVDFMQRDTSINIRHDVHQLNLDHVPLSVAMQHDAEDDFSNDMLSHFHSDIGSV